ncbi:MAG: ABC transporter permease [Sulfolobales archaeon]|nr:ABC transporter permease [Sulfolobales archaeon]MDW8083138.1 ABC transporter permease [Sulfolobales archaeon]
MSYSKNVKSVLSTAAILILALTLWEFSIYILKIPRYILPSPSSIIETSTRYSTYLSENLLNTLAHAITGLALAAVFSLALSLPLAYSETVREAISPLLAGFNAIPRAALVPLLALWFGLGSLPRILTSFLIAFYPILLPTLTAMVTVEKELWEILTSFGASKKQILVKVAIPRSMPYFLSSLHMGLASALVGTVIAEMIASDRGLGYVILSSTSRLDTPLAFSCLMLLALTTFTLSKALGIVEKRTVKWAYRVST